MAGENILTGLIGEIKCVPYTVLSILAVLALTGFFLVPTASHVRAMRLELDRVELHVHQLRIDMLTHQVLDIQGQEQAIRDAIVLASRDGRPLDALPDQLRMLAAQEESWKAQLAALAQEGGK